MIKHKTSPPNPHEPDGKAVNKIVHFRATAPKECFTINIHMKKNIVLATESNRLFVFDKNALRFYTTEPRICPYTSEIFYAGASCATTNLKAMLTPLRKMYILVPIPISQRTTANSA